VMNNYKKERVCDICLFGLTAQGLHNSLEKTRGLIMPLYNNSCAANVFTAI